VIQAIWRIPERLIKEEAKLNYKPYYALYKCLSNLCRDFGLFQLSLIFLTPRQDIQFDDLVTSARPRFQARSVEDRYPASDVTDQVPSL
jgi:hypothetical protein